MKKKPMETGELFNRICSVLKEKDMMPDILDYALADSSHTLITTYDFRLRNNLDYGGSEGIYLYLWIEFYKDKQTCIKNIGTFKTLHDKREAMYVMARLLADFIIELNSYVNSHPDDFIWEGIDVYALDKNGKHTGGSYTCESMEEALKMKDKLLKRNTCVVIRDNNTRKEKICNKENK